MKIKKVNSNKRIELIKHYQKLPLTRLLQIQPKWAYRENIDRILDMTIHPTNKEFTIFTVRTFDLIKQTNFHDFVLTPLFTGNMLNDGRIANLISHWENDAFVDPPSVSLSSEFRNKLSIDDGRHRTKLTWLLGHERIPIAIHNSQVDDIGKIIILTQL